MRELRAYQLNCVSLSSPPRVAVLTAGYKGLFQNCKIKLMLLLLLLLILQYAGHR